MNMKDQRNELAAKARNLAERAKAAGRDLTAAEVTSVNDAIGQIKGLDVQIKAADDAADMLRIIGSGPNTKADGAQYLDFRSKAFVKDLHSGIRTKGLAAPGSMLTGVPMITNTPVALGKPSLSFLDLLPITERVNPTYSYLRQVTRTNNAGPVEPGTLKNTSVYELKTIENKLRIVAHLSQPMNIYDLEDNRNLEAFLSMEMGYGIGLALENQIVNGTGVAPNFTGLLSTAGIQVHTASTTDKLITLRGAISKLDTAGYTASQFIMHPNDWTDIVVKRNAGGNFDTGGPVDSETRRAWGIPVSLSTQVAVGTAMLLAGGAIDIGIDKQGVQMAWGHDGGSFHRNQIYARLEGRFALDVMQPLGVVKINLTPPPTV